MRKIVSRDVEFCGCGLLWWKWVWSRVTVSRRVFVGSASHRHSAGNFFVMMPILNFNRLGKSE
jgi:hypothetical protein